MKVEAKQIKNKDNENNNHHFNYNDYDVKYFTRSESRK